mmetsp:Transcript_42689/g.121732  ORF Transcript_42689/g.121732 Transcript_42689/m.121732 type:complete len:166 (+) Transcript_42689:1-498(+)
MAHELREVLRPKAKTFKVREFASRSQQESFETTLALFEQAVGGPRAADGYDLIIITRHDVVWKRDLFSSSLLNCSNFNLASPCKSQTSIHTHGPCLNDILHMMPGSFYGAFRDLPCFVDHHGHDCYLTALKVSRLMEASIGFAFWDHARDVQTGRGANEWYGLCR